jgi:hypothetical protein
VEETMAEPIDWDGSLPVVQDLLLRADAMQRANAVVGEKLLIAQHRDTLRYQVVRGGTYVPRSRSFEAGDYVWLRRHNLDNTLQMDTMPPILRVRHVWPNGILTLRGKCGRTIKVNASHCALCTLSNIDTTVNPRLQRTTVACRVKFAAAPSGRLLCSCATAAATAGTTTASPSHSPPCRERITCGFVRTAWPRDHPRGGRGVAQG